MKLVDTHLSELEHRIAQLEMIRRSAREKSLDRQRVGQVESMYYWNGYADCADELIVSLRVDAQWRRDHPL